MGYNRHCRHMIMLLLGIFDRPIPSVAIDARQVSLFLLLSSENTAHIKELAIVFLQFILNNNIGVSTKLAS